MTLVMARSVTYRRRVRFATADKLLRILTAVHHGTPVQTCRCGILAYPVESMVERRTIVGQHRLGFVHADLPYHAAKILAEQGCALHDVAKRCLIRQSRLAIRACYCQWSPDSRKVWALLMLINITAECTGQAVSEMIGSSGMQPVTVT